MPTYEYVCKDCGQGLEVVQSFHDDALTVCPACSGTLRKKFSAAGIIFKGSGWHIKDYAKSGAKPESSEGGNGSSSDGGGDSGGGDSGGADSGASTSTTSDGGSTNTSSTSGSSTPSTSSSGSSKTSSTSSGSSDD